MRSNEGPQSPHSGFLRYPVAITVSRSISHSDLRRTSQGGGHLLFRRHHVRSRLFEKISLTTADVSTDKDEYVEIKWEWDPTWDTTYFYQYEIWQSANEEVIDTSMVVIIPDYKINHFWDRESGYGTSWYYSIATVDVNGRKVFSDFIRGRKNP